MSEHQKCCPAEDEGDSFSVATDDVKLKSEKTTIFFFKRAITVHKELGGICYYLCLQKKKLRFKKG